MYYPTIYNINTTPVIPSSALIQTTVPTTNSYYQQPASAHSITATTVYPTLPHHPAVSSSHVKDRKKPKRKQVKNACVNCQKACKKCDDGRACQRCIKLGLTATCVDSPRKERRKGTKRGPYKKRQQRQFQEENQYPYAVFPSTSTTSASAVHDAPEGWYDNQAGFFDNNRTSCVWPTTDPVYMVPQQQQYCWEPTPSPEMLAFDQLLLRSDVPLMTTASPSSTAHLSSPSALSPPTTPIAASSVPHHPSFLPTQQHPAMIQNIDLEHQLQPHAAVAQHMNNNKSTIRTVTSASSVHMQQQPYDQWPIATAVVTDDVPNATWHFFL